MEQLVFTPSAILDLLTQIDELKNVDIGVVETADGQIKLRIGESTYHLDTSTALDIEVEDEIVETVEAVNEDTYMNLDDSGEVEIQDADVIESGILKEAIKSLLLGGMIRLSAKLIK